MKQQGFTLVEMMVTIAVLAILVAMAYPSYEAYVQRARLDNARATMTDVNRLMEQLYAKNRTFCAKNQNTCQAPNIHYVDKSAGQSTEENAVGIDGDFYNFSFSNLDSSHYSLIGTPRDGLYSDSTLSSALVYLMYDTVSANFIRCNKTGIEEAQKTDTEANSTSASTNCEVM